MRPVSHIVSRQDTNWALPGLKKACQGLGRLLPVLCGSYTAISSDPHQAQEGDAWSWRGCAVLELEKLLCGLIIFLVSSYLERLHLFFRDGPCPAQIEMHLLSEMCLCEVLFSCL